ncbi:MAG: class I SAM-dependent methyltransferase [Nitrospiraceae bacterium]|nr:MAG: class I SAM-dependent methyltransferase [Nitrospiraceae bacterium]
MLKKISLFLLGRMSRVYDRLGVWVVPAHFYTPIPELEVVRKDDSWDSRLHEAPGIDLNVNLQQELLNVIFPRFTGEYDFPLDREEAGSPADFHFNNGMFANTDAEVYYGMLRHFRPRRIIEVGAGRSTQICCAAVGRNAGETGVRAQISIVEPYPNEMILGPLAGKIEMLRSKVEDVGPDFFTRLEENDVLFIDSSHVVKSAGDVNYLFLEVLPRLNPGVVVHIHDIRIPYEVPRLFLVEQARFFTEQYLLQAFLIGNNDFEILWGTYFMTQNFPGKVASVFRSSRCGTYAGGSFWIRRKTAQENA